MNNSTGSTVITIEIKGETIDSAHIKLDAFGEVDITVRLSDREERAVGGNGTSTEFSAPAVLMEELDIEASKHHLGTRFEGGLMDLRRHFCHAERTGFSVPSCGDRGRFAIMALLTDNPNGAAIGKCCIIGSRSHPLYAEELLCKADIDLVKSVGSKELQRSVSLLFEEVGIDDKVVISGSIAIECEGSSLGQIEDCIIVLLIRHDALGIIDCKDNERRSFKSKGIEGDGIITGDSVGIRNRRSSAKFDTSSSISESEGPSLSIEGSGSDFAVDFTGERA